MPEVDLYGERAGSGRCSRYMNMSELPTRTRKRTLGRSLRRARRAERKTHRDYRRTPRSQRLNGGMPSRMAIRKPYARRHGIGKGRQSRPAFPKAAPPAVARVESSETNRVGSVLQVVAVVAVTTVVAVGAIVWALGQRNRIEK